ncbi:hypothetical protein BASA81_008288 [Batrachochytrium salamandrivorans]|nr:hypothetical protein BASA81_008288 [Batrachochytrium salamandrivorans]
MAEPFFASSGFAEILKAAGLGDMDMDAFRMLEEARQLVQDGEMEVEEYEELSRGVQLQLLQLATSGAARAQQQQQQAAKPPAPARIPRMTTASAPMIQVPKDEKPIIESLLSKLPIVVSGGKAPEDLTSKLLHKLPKKFEKKYCVLYKHCLVFYDKKGDKLPKGRIDLTGDFFVQDSNEHAHGFVLSDMNVTCVLGADTEGLKSYWIHMCAMVLRKLNEPTPTTPVDESDSLKARFQSKLKQFKQEKPSNRRQSMFFRKKQQKEEEEQERQNQLVEAREMAAELKAQELRRQRELEDLEQQLKIAQEEKDRFRTEAELEHERANVEAARAREEEQRRANAETLLAKTLEDLRAESLAREEALLEEKEEVARRLQMTMDKRRQSMLPGAKQASSEDFEKWEKERKALQAKLNALMDALNVDLGELEWDGTLEDAEQKMKDLVPALCSEDEKESRAAQVKFDQYDKVIRNHADYKSREEQKWVKWEADQAPKNLASLEEMKRIVPHEVLSGISEDFLLNQCGLQLPVCKRIMTTKIYAFYYMDMDVISKLHIADLSSRYVCQGLDLRELRAVYYCLPKEFQLDPDGRKKLWRDDCRVKLKALTDKEDAGKLSKNEAMHAAFRPKEEKKPVAAAAPGARPPNPMAGALAGMLNKKAEADVPSAKPNLANLFANRGPPPGGGGDGEEDAPTKPNLAAMLAGRKPLPVMGDEETPKPSLAGLFANRGPPPAAAAVMSNATLATSPDSDNGGAKLDTSALQSALASKMNGRDRGKSTAQVEALIELIRPESSARLVSLSNAGGGEAPPRKNSLTSNLVRRLSGSRPSPTALAAPAVAKPKTSLLPNTGGGAPRAPPPMIDLGVKFNSAPQKDNVAEAQAMFNKATGGRSAMDAQDVPTYDFEGQTTARRKTWVDDGIAKLVGLIEENGQVDKAEGGKKTATFGVLFDKFGPGSDMLVGILMRARKKGKVKYVGDMLFKGVHDNVKITIL